MRRKRRRDKTKRKAGRRGSKREKLRASSTEHLGR